METSQGYSVQFHWGEAESVTQKVVEALADATGKDPTEMDPIATEVDPDALDALFAPREGGEQRNRGHVSFTVANCEVTVHAHGEVVVRE